MTNPRKAKPPKLGEIAARIDVHLKRMEADPVINERRRFIGGRWVRSKGQRSGVSRFYHAWATRAGRYVQVQYVSYQNVSSLTKSEAVAYLARLDAGNNGRHYEAPR